MKIYICGSYSRLEHQAAFDKFDETEKQLINAGISPEKIVNPLKLGIHKDTPWSDAMKICMKHLKKCDTLFIQKDWKESFGARKEITYADQNNYELYWEANNDIKSIKSLIALSGID